MVGDGLAHEAPAVRAASIGRRRLRIVAGLSLSLSLGCTRQQPPPSPGRPAVPRRIVSLAPSLTETVFALGLGDRVVGVDDFSVWPPAVAALPRLGGLFNPNLERTVTLHPDLALVVPSEAEVAAKLGRLGIPSLVVPGETLADVERSFTAIARRCGLPAAGERLAARWRAELAPQHLPGSLKVLLSIERDPGRLSGVVVAGPHTFFDELLRRLGAVNAFADAPARYPQVGLEEVLARAPDAILELRNDSLGAARTQELLRDWQRLASVPAVRNGRVIVIAGDFVTLPGPRLPVLYRQMRTALASPGARR
jgi:iron complex transport system substrate-binding protein